MSELEDVTIRMAEPDDADAIIDFLREHWIIKNHVFTRRRDLFENLHLVEGRLTYLLAVGNETGRILGVLGYSYNNHDFGNPDMSDVIFQTLKTKRVSLGFDMILELQRLTNSRVLFCPGIVKKTLGLYKYLGYETGLMSHYYRLAERDSYQIAQVVNPPVTQRPDKDQWALTELPSMEQIEATFPFEEYRDILPYRDAWSVRRRYFENIGYTYHIWGIAPAGEQIYKALVVGRFVQQNGKSMLKLIDFIGSDEALAHCYDAFGTLIDENDLEYVDIYEVGIPDEYLTEAGFTLREKNDANIIPNYFEPFEQRNVDIWYFTTNTNNFHAYRTDAGQDRPNFIEDGGSAC